MFAALFRLIFGLIVACLVGGAVQVLFALTPAELAVAGPERWQIAADWTLQSAAVISMVAAPIVLLLGLFTEIMAVRSFAFYLLAGIFVALAGFAILYTGETPNGPTLANSYAIAAYLTTGFMSGVAYWLVSGRFAGGRRANRKDFADKSETVVETKSETTATTPTKPAGGGSNQKPTTGTVPVTATRKPGSSVPSSGGSTATA